MATGGSRLSCDARPSRSTTRTWRAACAAWGCKVNVPHAAPGRRTAEGDAAFFGHTRSASSTSERTVQVGVVCHHWIVAFPFWPHCASQSWMLLLACYRYLFRPQCLAQGDGFLPGGLRSCRY